MTKKYPRKPVSEKDVELTRETFHLVFAVAPVLAAIFATLFGKHIHHLVIELVLIGLVIGINFYLLWLRSKTDENAELNLLYTFWTNDLPPIQSGERQAYDVKVAIIEVKGSSYYRTEVQRRFKAKFDVEALKALMADEPRLKSPILREQKLETFVSEVTDRNLYFKPVEVDPSVQGNPEELRRDFQNTLNNDLEGCKAVVVVRADALDERDWVYKTIDSWAHRHSEIPIIFAKDLKKNFAENATAERFLWIPDDPRALPWSLLQRATERGKAWQSQATYNRAMVWNIFYIALLCIYIGAIWIHSKEEGFEHQLASQEAKLKEEANSKWAGFDKNIKSYDAALDGANSALETEKSYRAFTSRKDDATLSVSYWFSHTQKPYLFVTTELHPSTLYFENGYDSIIGCGFAEPNRIFEGRSGAKTAAYDNYGQPVADSKCQSMKQLDTSKIESIACATYNGTLNPRIDTRTVGICVFTESKDNNIFQAGYQRFLRERAIQFYKEFSEKIDIGVVTSLEARKMKERAEQ